MQEVHKKFKWIPHYAKVDFVFAVAIAGDQIQMKAFNRQTEDKVSEVRAVMSREGLPTLTPP